jgi:hypothetical protein
MAVTRQRRSPAARLATLVVLALGLGPNLLAAQWALGVDTGVWSRYHWRGLTRRNGAVWQTDLMVARRLGPTFLTLGGWTSIELSRADPRIAEDIGLGHFFGEVDAWLEWSYVPPGTGVELALGYTRYWFPRASAAAALGSAVVQTGEAYARLIPRVGPLTPRLAVWYDPHQTKGAYLEAGLAYDLVVLPALWPVLRFGGVAGLSAGQAVDPADPAEPGYFTDNGPTHVDLYTQAQLSLGIAGVPIYLLPAAHLQFNVDQSVKVTDRAGGTADRTFWVALTVSFQAGR